MRARVILTLMLACVAPASAAAQIALSAGGNAASRVGDGSVNVWTAGGQITLAPSDKVAFILVANVIVGDRDDNPDTRITGSHLLTAVRFLPFRRLWYIGTGMAILHERWEIVGRFRSSGWKSEDLAPVWFTGLGFSVDRVRPFAEFRMTDFLGSANQRVYAFGVDVKIN